MFPRLLLAAAVGLAVTPVPAAERPAPAFQDRWFYAMTNLQVADQADALVRLIERAGKAGYNGMVLADYKLNILDRVPAHYFKHLARVRAAADKAGIEVIPAVFPIGYSSGLLAHDANLAEGLPVKDARFVVHGGVARLAADPPTALVNGTLEQTRGDRFVGFSYQDEPGKDLRRSHRRPRRPGGLPDGKLPRPARAPTAGSPSARCGRTPPIGSRPG
ncbi:MAG: hypothetical protein U0736_20480 [Gemmataceae bacterium]